MKRFAQTILRSTVNSSLDRNFVHSPRGRMVTLFAVFSTLPVSALAKPGNSLASGSLMELVVDMLPSILTTVLVSGGIQ